MKKILKYLFSITISVLLLYFLLSKINLQEIIKVFSQTNIFYLIIGGVLYLLMMIFRSLRFRTLLNNKLKATELLPIVLFQSFLSNILPFRVGELSYVILLKKKKYNISKGLSSLLIARIFDFGVLISILIISILLSKNLPSKDIFNNMIPILFIALSIIVIAIICMIFLHDFILKIMQNLLKKLPKIKLLDKFNEFIISFKNYKSKRMLLKTLYYAIVIYFFGIISNYYFIKSLGFELPLNILIITITFSVLSSVLPINGFASLGTMEGIWVIILGYFNYGVQTAILISFSLHIILLLFSVLFGVIGWMKLEK